MDQAALLKLLTGREPEAITRTLAMMAYNLAIGRELEKGGVGHFANLMVETIPRFYGVVTRDHFETVHAGICERILTSFKNNRGGTLSYGQAQKPLNVFLKVYVDWAKQPDRELADNLAPFLHVPLDSIVMEFIGREFPQEYQTRIITLRKRIAEFVAQRLEKTTPHMVERALLRDEFWLVGLNKELYLAWQQFLRTLYPAKPVLLDIIWVLERREIRAEAADA